MKLFGPYKKRSRSASMQLSINAIVILVMAMAVLGLGLGLIRGVLGQGKDKLMKSLTEMDISEEATPEKPIANANSISLTRGKETPLVISYYNTNSACNTAKMNIVCFDKTGTIDDGFFSDYSVVPADLISGGATRIGAAFTVNESISSGSHGCKVQVACFDPADPNNPEKNFPLDSLTTYVEVVS